MPFAADGSTVRAFFTWISGLIGWSAHLVGLGLVLVTAAVPVVGPEQRSTSLPRPVWAMRDGPRRWELRIANCTQYGPDYGLGRDRDIHYEIRFDFGVQPLAKLTREPRYERLLDLGKTRMSGSRGEWVKAYRSVAWDTLPDGTPGLQFTTIHVHWLLPALIGFPLALLPVALPTPRRSPVVRGYRWAGLAVASVVRRLAAGATGSRQTRGFEVLRR